MYSICFGILRNQLDAEDALQDTFCKIIKNPKVIFNTSLADLKGYMIVASRNTAFTKLNSIRNQECIEDIEESVFSDMNTNPEKLLLSKLENIDIFNIPNMNDRYRDVVILKYYYDLNTKEIAFILNITEENVRSRLSRAIKQVRMIYGKGGSYK